VRAQPLLSGRILKNSLLARFWEHGHGAHTCV